MTDQGKPEGQGSEYDRMSLNSLKRELEVQKSKTDLAREEARERIREGAERRGVPWGDGAGDPLRRWRAPRRRGLLLPRAARGERRSAARVHPPTHPGRRALRAPGAPPPPVRRDAGAAAPERPRPHGPRRHQETERGGRELDFGDTDDPIEGLGDSP
ncbi:MAG: hypothetical protein M5U28_53280 [Sandaracinaceae bacterium]|nr:hypothetical protein [Sandaracinaceae bacterium]